MLRDIEVDDPPAVVREQHKHEQDSAREHWDGKEVHRHQRRHVIRQEGPPAAMPILGGLQHEYCLQQKAA
jgi:hypothetical protein